MRKSLKKVWTSHRKTWKNFKKRFWKRSKSNKGLSIHKLLIAIGFSLVLISIVGYISTRTAEVAKVGETTETTTTTTQETTTTAEETTTIEATTTPSTAITTTITATISKDLEKDLKELGHHVTHVERNEERWQFGNFENYVLVVIKQIGLIPETGPMNRNRFLDISENVDFFTQKYYPDSEVWITLVFSKCGGRFIRCVKSVPEVGIKKHCTEMRNLPEKYC